MSDKRIVKVLASLNDFIDGDRQRLCDRIKMLERSHKRMLDLIKASRYYVVNYDELPLKDVACFIEVLDREIERQVL